MKKSISLAIIAVMMVAAPAFLTSCGNDGDILDDVPEVQKPTITAWIEPIHTQGASMDEVKDYMTASMTGYALAGEQTSQVNYQLVYTGATQSVGVVYSFTKPNSALYSVIATELCVNKDIVLKYLNEHYSIVPGFGNETQEIKYLYTTSDKSTVISTAKVSYDCFNVTYSFVTH